MRRVNRQDEEEHQRREVEQMLDRVHRKARPGGGRDVAMMDGVHPHVERFPVQRPMNDEEMCALAQREQREERHEPHGMAGKVNLDENPLRVHHARENLPGGGDGCAIAHRSENVVPGLMAQEEARPAPPSGIGRVELAVAAWPRKVWNHRWSPPATTASAMALRSSTGSTQSAESAAGRVIG